MLREVKTPDPEKKIKCRLSHEDLIVSGVYIMQNTMVGFPLGKNEKRRFRRKKRRKLLKKRVKGHKIASFKYLTLKISYMDRASWTYS